MATRGQTRGGMGAICPTPASSPELMKEIGERIFRPVLDTLRKRGIYYRGVLYAGLILTKQGPKVLEFNCRFGDPEAQAMLPRLESDLLELLSACVEGNLDPAMELKWRPESCACVVASSPGYPEAPEIGKTIRGLEKFRAEKDVVVFYAGVAREGEKLITSGGRVLGVSALGDDVETARARALAALKQINFQGMHYRKDIGWRALAEKK
ncbi:MAG: phosphoribosylglycinamide synthetase C domain-containing protein [bacterium]